ncbi:DNA repair protein RecN (Recombination protein N) [Micrococcales bacterium KH10]|nr:DNA repair protein RecN (Recombination protein N) [Micrococcales bacterium KH10]
MIRDLRIIDLGVISEAVIEPGDGLTAISGETGAGKTMILQSLSLLRGDRADSTLVRSGAREAVVECELDIVDPELAHNLESAGGHLEDARQLLLVRSVAAAGRSKFLAGGRSVPRAAVAELMNSLLTIHGQSDQLRLRDTTTQRDTIDQFAGADHLATVAQYRQLWHERSQVTQRLEELVDHAAERAREAELLRLGLETIDEVAPQTGEDEQLANEAERLRHGEDLRDYVNQARLLLVGADIDSEAAAGAVDAALRGLERAETLDGSLTEITTTVRDISFRLADVGIELARYLDDLVVAPGRLEEVEQRRNDLAKIARSYGPTIADALAWAEQARVRLTELDDDSEIIEELRNRRDALSAQLEELANGISRGRRDAAQRLSTAVDSELADLAMPEARLTVEFQTTDELGPHGADTMTMLFSSHPEAPARPLARAASGGELSRVMLALEVVLVDNSVTTYPMVMVFDEIDAGVGGRAATAIGRRLAQLAAFHQVIVVTHLAQVAAQADTHLVVNKINTKGTGTASYVTRVDDEERIVELARMLSGEDESETARAHAQELLSAAAMRG